MNCYQEAISGVTRRIMDAARARLKLVLSNALILAKETLIGVRTSRTTKNFKRPWALVNTIWNGPYANSTLSLSINISIDAIMA